MSTISGFPQLSVVAALGPGDGGLAGHRSPRLRLLTWTQTLSLSGPLRVAEPKTLRLRLLAVAGRLTRSGEPNYGWTGAGPGLPRSPPP